MKITRLLPLLAVVGLLAACDETRNLLATQATEQVQVVPRLVASSPLPGARLQITLVSGGKTVATLDTAYQSRQKLSLGSVAVGDSFRVSAQGYDTLGREKLVTWTTSFAGKAAGSSSEVLGVDLIVQSPSTADLDTLAHPDSVVVGAGYSYTYDGNDPRSGASHAQKTFDTTVLSKANLSISRYELVNGTVLWSPVRKWSDPGSFLMGEWWEVDTSYDGGRSRAFFIRLNKDHTYYWIDCDKLTMDSSKNVGSGHHGFWSGDSANLHFRNSSGGTDVELTRKSSDTIGVDWGVQGVMTRAKPDTDYVTPLLGTWWQLWYQGTDSIPLLQEHIIHHDGTITVNYHFSQSSLDSTYAMHWSVTSDSLALGFSTKTVKVGYTLTDTLLTLSSTDTLTRSKPYMLDYDLVATWKLDGIGTFTFANDGTVTVDQGTGSTISEPFSTGHGNIYFYDHPAPTIQGYVISGGTLTIGTNVLIKQ
jgi:hypothetical protein